MLESVLDRGLAAGGMLPHVAAQLPTLVSGLVTALERTPDAAATAALADDPAPSAAPLRRQRGGSGSLGSQQASLGRSVSLGRAGAGVQPERGRPKALIQLINKLTKDVSSRLAAASLLDAQLH